MQYIFILNEETKEDVREKTSGIVVEAEKIFKEYQEEYLAKYAESRQAGRLPPAYNPPPYPSVIFSCELLCSECGKKCGNLDFNRNKGVEGALDELKNYTTRCEEHPV